MSAKSAEKRNVLFIMADQLRWDYLSCAGHPTLKTPHIDWLANQGVRFSRAYVQSPICGPSRMSFYTGRYMQAHGVTANDIPLKVGEVTLGDHLRKIGSRAVLVGKTHMRADVEGLARLGIDPTSPAGRHAAECGFDVFERDDGVHPDGPRNGMLAYNAYLKSKGYDGANPWHTWANSAAGEDGATSVSGWLLKHSTKPARVREEDSETPYMTARAIECIDSLGDAPWCVHLSYIKPHWPYIAPAPYHNMYTAADMTPVVRSDTERTDVHPVFGALMQRRVSRAFAQDAVRDSVVPVYMGLVKQIDDQIGRLLAYLKDSGQLANTVIVFTSDHGDYLGDHWLGEKDFFHDASVKIPLIVYDPDSAADASRGTVCDALVEAIDLVPTFIEMQGGDVPAHRLDGRSLMPLLRGERPADWRTMAVSEYDYALRAARRLLGVAPDRALMTMAVTDRWKYVLAEGFPPLLFDLVDDPDELVDRGRDPALAAVRAELHERLFEWARSPRQRTTESPASLENRTDTQVERGLFVGFWDEDEVALERDHIARRGRVAAAPADIESE